MSEKKKKGFQSRLVPNDSLSSHAYDHDDLSESLEEELDNETIDLSIDEQEEKYIAYLKWKATPKEERNPPLLAHFIEENDLTEFDIKEFHTRPSFEDDLVNMTMKWAKYKSAEIIHMLYNRIKSEGKTADIKEWREMIAEQQKQKRETALLPTTNQQNITNNLNISDEQFERIIQAAAKRKSSTG